MPSWSARLHSSTSTSSSNATHSNTSAAVNSDRNVPLSFNHDVPVLLPLDTPARKPPTRRTHSRSLSHPFPSLFSSSSKKSDKKVSKRDFLDSSDDDDVTYAPDPRSSSPRRPSHHATPAEDFLTGKCMTCDSTVRWPRGLKVFRCTVCLTINDLEPCRESNDLPGHGHPASHDAPHSHEIHRKAVPLSVERTRSIIDRCVTTYLRSRIDSINKPLPPPPPGLSVEHFDDARVSEQNRRPHAAQRRVERTPSPVSRPPSSPRQALNVDGRSLSPKQPVGAYAKGDNGLLAPSPSDADRRYSRRRGLSGSDIPTTPERDRSPRGRGQSPNVTESKSQSDSRPSIFRPLEDYIISSFRGCDCLNNSFVTPRPRPRAASESNPSRTNLDPSSLPNPLHAPPAFEPFEPDAKTLRLGDIGENSSWWIGGRPQHHDTKDAQARDRSPDPSRATVTPRSPRIDWAALAEWYRLIMVAGESWFEKWSEMMPDNGRGEGKSSGSKRWDSVELSIIEKEITESRIHAQRTLLKATENLLKRPRRPLKKPEDTRFLLILLANPLLYSPSSSRRQQSAPSSSLTDERDRSRSKDSNPFTTGNAKSSRRDALIPPGQNAGGPGHHSGIIKRLLGLISNLPNECHHFFVSWFSRFSEGQFQRTVDLVGSFVTYRLSRQQGRRRSESSKNDNGLVPSLSGTARDTHAQLHAAISGRTPSKSPKDGSHQPIVYSEDWQIRAAARVMSLLFAANNANVPRKRDGILSDQRSPGNGVTTKHNSYSHGQMIPISAFYNTLLDYSDLVADFEAWESRSAKFSFCQYPFFLSIWAKIHILEYDARRQMEVKAREAFFNSILTRKAESQYLVLKVRRDCLVEDSLRGVSEVVGSGREEIKKGLRIEFLGEEGVDAGGLRKEWFLLLVREVFDPNHGLFIYDEDSRFCYFNPFCFESSEQFFLVGVLLGLAIYNSTILDIALPPFAFKKLLASAPPSSAPAASTSRSNFTLTLDDLAEYRPALAKGLRALLEYDGDVQETFCHDFVAQVDRYGEIIEVPLCPGGEKRAVTNANRREFVDLYVHYLLDTAVSRQFEPFKRGFFTVCGGNALSLFRPEEIELLVRGSDEPLDVASLRAVATYENWSTPHPEAEPVVRWFWELFESASAQDQRKLLSFITGSDRIPAMGATNLIIRLACLGGDSPRYPIARTCFNILGLYRYATKEKLAKMLWGAVANSEGFGLR